MNTNDKSVKNEGLVLTSAPLSSNTPQSISSDPRIPSISASAVLGESASMPEGTPICQGFDFNNLLKNDNEKDKEKEEEEDVKNVKFDALDGILSSMIHTGFQATNVGLAIDRINELRRWRLSDIPYRKGIDDEELELDIHSKRPRLRARIFLSYTSNQISCGQREIIRFLVQHSMIDVIVTTAGGIEEDLIKCFQPTYMGDFSLKGAELRKKGINRIGNLLVPNKNYCEFEDWIGPILTAMHNEQDQSSREWAKQMATQTEEEEIPERFVWTPSKVIDRLGKEINHESSVLYWAHKNSIPIFCPALTDGSFGDMLYFHSYKRPGFLLDIASDVRRINDLAIQSHATAMIVLGGGLVKHHTCNANLMRNGADWSVFINTAHEFDGSDSGASPDEAISWGKIRSTARPVKVCADASLVFPLIVSQTFAKDVHGWKERRKGSACWWEDL